MLQSSTASPHTYPTPAPSSATSKALNDTSVCSVWGDLPAALSGCDSCHQVTEGETPSSLFHCTYHLEEGSVDWRGRGSRLVCEDSFN